MVDSSFRCIIPGSESPDNNKNIVVKMKRIIINMEKKLEMFLMKNYTVYEYMNIINIKLLWIRIIKTGKLGQIWKKMRLLLP